MNLHSLIGAAGRGAPWGPDWLNLLSGRWAGLGCQSPGGPRCNIFHSAQRLVFFKGISAIQELSPEPVTSLIGDFTWRLSLLSLQQDASLGLRDLRGLSSTGLFLMSSLNSTPVQAYAMNKQSFGISAYAVLAMNSVSINIYLQNRVSHFPFKKCGPFCIHRVSLSNSV